MHLRSQGNPALMLLKREELIAVTKVAIVQWPNYKHLTWITVRRDDDTLYKFKEGDFHRLRIQDIEDMLLLLVQGKLQISTLKNLAMALRCCRNALNDAPQGNHEWSICHSTFEPTDKVNARAMIQAIDKRLKTRRIFRSLERFVGGRPYGDDFRLLQRTI
ncbi:hypothetical protein Tco_0549203 [Tanacetum coccineum]